MTPPRLLFVHVMKTGGATLRWQLRQALDGRRVYPHPALDGEMIGANFDLERCQASMAERDVDADVVTGHFPWYALDAFPDTPSATMLRDPVSRTVSHLKHARRHHIGGSEMTLEQLYEDPYTRECYVRDHMTKVFALEPGTPDGILANIRLGDGAVDRALEHLARFDLIGFNDEHERFADQVGSLLGVQLASVDAQRRGESDPVPARLIDRITEDSATDRAFYDGALELAASREAA